MIIFDRFLCCIKLKSFGKFFGWIGTTFSILLAYATFLVASGRKAAGENTSNHMIIGRDWKTEDFYYICGLIIAFLLIISIFHIMLICGIKYLKSILIVPYVILSVILTAALICILPSEIHLTASHEHEATSPYLIAACIFGLILGVYFALCVYSLYELIKYEEKRRKLYRNADAILIAPLTIWKGFKKILSLHFYGKFLQLVNKSFS